MTSDITLINQIKVDNDSAAMAELVHRHTGMYVKQVNQHAPYLKAKVNVDDLKDDRYYNIHRWALSFDPTREMKFGSYVGEMAKFMCLNILNRAPESVEFCEAIAPTNDTGVLESVDRAAVIEEISQEVDSTESEMFKKVFNARFGGQRPLGWRGVGRAVGLSHEGARKLYEKHIGAIREHLST